ncbi:MAG: hypothetical protein LBT55_06365 [Clostridiaceae bacterium]|jgi:ribosomal protein S27E|nr:hypothetical protein [Clostridiaceae bacterium]
MKAPCPVCKYEITIPEGIKKGKLFCPKCAHMLKLSTPPNFIIAECPYCRVQFEVLETVSEDVVCPACGAFLSSEPLQGRKGKHIL